jgi:hypothetical protein
MRYSYSVADSSSLCRRPLTTMPDQLQIESSAASEMFYASALTRIRRFMILLGVVLFTAAWWRFGLRPAAGFLLGSAIAYLNFHWLKSGVAGLADRVTAEGTPQSGKGIVARFLLRYVLLAAAAYAILTSFAASLGGLFVGLFLPVGAITCEAAYEIYAGIRRGI